MIKFSCLFFLCQGEAKMQKTAAFNHRFCILDHESSLRSSLFILNIPTLHYLTRINQSGMNFSLILLSITIFLSCAFLKEEWAKRILAALFNVFHASGYKSINQPTIQHHTFENTSINWDVSVDSHARCQEMIFKLRAAWSHWNRIKMSCWWSIESHYKHVYATISSTVLLSRQCA